MKTFLVAGLFIVVTPSAAVGQGATLGSVMPAAPPRHLVRYRYMRTALVNGTGHVQGAPTTNATQPDQPSLGDVANTTGSVDIAVDGGTLYYREYRGGNQYLELLLNRKDRRVLLFNHQQNRLNVLRDIPYRAAQFIPFPFQDEEIPRLLRPEAAENALLSPKTATVAVAGAVGQTGHTAPVTFRATLTNTASGPRVDTFSIQSPAGDVADWAFTYPPTAGARSLPAEVRRVVALPFMTEAERAAFLRREIVPPTHWRPDAEIRYTLVEDRPARDGEIPSEESFFRSANAQTTVVDRRDLKNPISFLYRKDGGDLESQIQAARNQTAPANGSQGASLAVGGGVLVLVALGTGWVVRRRIVRRAHAQTS